MRRDGLRDTPQSGYDDSKALIAHWHGKGRALYAITPRFAITSSPEQMEMAGALVREHPDCHMQTHLSENHAEIAFTQELYPWSRDYTDVYEHYGLLGAKEPVRPLHPSVRPRGRCAVGQSASVAVFCPTSNLFLGSGLFDYQRFRRARQAAQDRHGHRCRRRHQLFDAAHHGRGLQGDRAERREAQSAASRSGRLTRGNAEALSIGGSVGRLDAGNDADIVVLDASGNAGDAAQDGDGRDACGRIVSAADAGRRPRRASRPMSPDGPPRARCRQHGRGARRVEGDGNGRRGRHRTIASQEEAPGLSRRSTRPPPSRSARPIRERGLNENAADHRRHQDLRPAAVLCGAAGLDRLQCRLGAAQAQCGAALPEEHLPHGAGAAAARPHLQAGQRPRHRRLCAGRRRLSGDRQGRRRDRRDRGFRPAGARGSRHRRRRRCATISASRQALALALPPRNDDVMEPTPRPSSPSIFDAAVAAADPELTIREHSAGKAEGPHHRHRRRQRLGADGGGVGEGLGRAARRAGRHPLRLWRAHASASRSSRRRIRCPTPPGSTPRDALLARSPG